MPTPTSIPETPMAQPLQEPTQEVSEYTSVSDTMEVFNHVVEAINEAEVATFQN